MIIYARTQHFNEFTLEDGLMICDKSGCFQCVFRNLTFRKWHRMGLEFFTQSHIVRGSYLTDLDRRTPLIIFFDKNLERFPDRLQCETCISGYLDSAQGA